MIIAKLQDNKINIQKLISFLYTSNAQVEFEIREIVLFTWVPPKMEYLGINLTKYVWNLSEENQKTLMKDIKE